MYIEHALRMRRRLFTGLPVSLSFPLFKVIKNEKPVWVYWVPVGLRSGETATVYQTAQFNWFAWVICHCVCSQNIKIHMNSGVDWAIRIMKTVSTRSCNILKWSRWPHIILLVFIIHAVTIHWWLGERRMQFRSFWLINCAGILDGHCLFNPLSCFLRLCFVTM